MSGVEKAPDHVESLPAVNAGDLRDAGIIIAALVVRLGGVVRLHPYELAQAVGMVVQPAQAPNGDLVLESVMSRREIARA